MNEYEFQGRQALLLPSTKSHFIQFPAIIKSPLKEEKGGNNHGLHSWQRVAVN